MEYKVERYSEEGLIRFVCQVLESSMHAFIYRDRDSKRWTPSDISVASISEELAIKRLTGHTKRWHAGRLRIQKNGASDFWTLLFTFAGVNF